MLKIAIVEDNKTELNDLKSLLASYQEEKKVDFSVESFERGEELLSRSDFSYDLLFLDIELPGRNGMDVARKIRETNGDVAIIFVTCVTALAVEGYSVDAFDYIVKPIEKYPFFTTMMRVIKNIERKGSDRIILCTPEGYVYLNTNQISYIESFGHSIVYHAEGKEYREWTSLAKPEKILGAKGFYRISKSFLINLRYVQKIVGDEVYVAGVPIKIGKTKKKDFLTKLNIYFSV